MKRSNAWLTALLQIAILLSVVAFATPWLIAAESPLPTPRHSGDITLRGRPTRPVFNGSVVPGGVYSLDELRSAVDRDAVVAAHYRNAKVDEMRVETLTSGKAAYVSYRRGDRVHWTRERVWLNAGETVLTDGTTVIRARCGNCVSEVKQDGVAAVNPAHGELDDFVVPPTPDAGVDAFAADAEAGLGNLLQVPFALVALASLTPGDAPPLPGPIEDPFSEPGFHVVPLIVPTGGTGGGAPGAPGPTVLPGLPGVGDPPLPPPPGFVPPDGGTGTPGLGTGSPDGTTGSPGGSTSGTPAATTGGSSTGSPTDTLTTGLPLDTTSSLSTGTPTGGGFFVTTVGVSTTSGGATSAPEPGVLWLVAAGVIGLARRRLRK